MSRDNSPGEGMRKRNQSFLETHRGPRKHSHAKHQRRTKINKNTRTLAQRTRYNETDSREPSRASQPNEQKSYEQYDSFIAPLLYLV